MNYSKMKFSVGLFVIVLIISLGWFGYFLLESKGAFEKRFRFYLTTNSAEYISIGMPVKFSGFKIGQVDEIRLKDDGNVNIYFSVNEQNRKWINIYTYLVIKKPLIGSAYIDVLATSKNKLLEPNSKLPVVLTDDINDMVAKLEPAVDKLLNIIKNIDTITTNLSKEDSSLFQTFKNLQNLTSEKSSLAKSLKNLNAITSRISKDDSLLTSITGDKNSTKALNDSIKQLNSILKDIKNTTSKLNKDIIKPTSNSLKELLKIFKDINKKLTELDPFINEISSSPSDINALKQNIKSITQKTDQILEKIDQYLIEKNDNEVLLP